MVISYSLRSIILVKNYGTEGVLAISISLEKGPEVETSKLTLQATT